MLSSNNFRALGKPAFDPQFPQALKSVTLLFYDLELDEELRVGGLP
jgi:hypothetical protein